MIISLQTWGSAALIGAVVTTGLTAGLLYVFAHSVMPGLGTLDDRGFLTAFQRIDAAITNPWMALAYLGSPALTLAALVLRTVSDGRASAGVVWLVVALVLVAATVVITGAVHLPLNAAVQEAAPAFADAADLRARFEDTWVTWNVVRTATSTASVTALGVALVLAGRAA